MGSSANIQPPVSPSSSSGHSGGINGLPFRRKPIIRTPAITSSNWSHSTARAATTGQLATALSQTAIVRTWQSRQANTKLSDIFSLGAVMIDIFTYLCERKLSSFTSHRGAKNRTPGRGGGVADASFHLSPNLGQVTSWITLLEQDSKKRKGPAFRAVQPMLEVVRLMMAKSPEKRPSAAYVEREFTNIARQLGGIIELHCQPKVASTNKTSGGSQEPQAVEGKSDATQGEPSKTSSRNGLDKLDFGFAPRRWETNYTESSDEPDHDDYDPDIVILQNALRKHWNESTYYDDISILPMYEE
jgi:hypothetical protein